MEKFVEYITDNIAPFILGILGLFVPGILTVFIFNIEFFVEIDIVKLIALSISISAPSFAFWIFIGCLIDKEGDVFTEWQPAFVFNLITFAIMLFIKIVYRNMTSTQFVIGIASICIIGSVISYLENRHRN